MVDRPVGGLVGAADEVKRAASQGDVGTLSKVACPGTGVAGGAELKGSLGERKITTEGVRPAQDDGPARHAPTAQLVVDGQAACAACFGDDTGDFEGPGCIALIADARIIAKHHRVGDVDHAEVVAALGDAQGIVGIGIAAEGNDPVDIDRQVSGEGSRCIDTQLKQATRGVHREVLPKIDRVVGGHVELNAPGARRHVSSAKAQDVLGLNGAPHDVKATRPGTVVVLKIQDTRELVAAA